MQAGETIFAVATGAGTSPRALLRVSGPGVAGIEAALVEGLCESAAREPGRSAAAVTLLLGKDGPRVRALLMAARGPNTYTGEDCAELLVPGGEAVAAALASRLIGLGARRAQPGEFTERAYRHGRLSLERAEGVAAVIAAASETELTAARALLRGRLGHACVGIGDRLASLLALVEAGIDFTDQEDVVPITPARLAASLKELSGELSSMLGAGSGGERAGHRPAVVLAGLPSSGKSALFNALLARERSVVAPEAGTTRDAIAEPTALFGSMGRRLETDLTDVAGLDAGPAAHARAQAAAGEALSRAALVLWCQRPLSARADVAADTDARASLPPHTQVIVVGTMADLGPHEPPVDIRVCALDGWNLRSLRGAMFDALWSLGARGASSGAATLWPRHREALSQARDALERAAAVVALEETRLEAAELIAERLRAALDALGQLTGRIETEDLLGRVFGAFCIGK